MALNNRPLTTFPIPPCIQTKLSKAGFFTAANILCFRPSELSSSNYKLHLILSSIFTILRFSSGAEITIEEAADVLDTVGKPNTALRDMKTALELLYDELSHLKITSFCERLDSIFEGGIPFGKLTEISGIAGVGKTQVW